MNRRLIVIAIAGAAAALFAGASLYYANRSDTPPAPPIETSAQQSSAPEAAEATPTEAPNASTSVPSTAANNLAQEAGSAPPPRWNAYVREHSPVIGRVDAPVTIVEFLDPACEACRAFYPVVHEILRRHPQEVRLVVRYTPLHEGSDEAVRILETARMQNVFEPVLTALFQQQPQWADHGTPRIDRAWATAQGAGLNVETARAAMQARHIGATITQDIADAGTLRVRGTPTFFVNEKPLTEFGAQQLYQLVLSEIEATR